MTDLELLKRYTLEGSADAFAEIVNRHTRTVYAACMRILGDPHAAEDAAQATFLILMRKGAKLPAGTVLAGWLYRTAVWAARDLRKTSDHRSKHEREAAAMIAQRADSESARDLEAIRPTLDSALAALPASQRDAVVLRYLYGCSEEWVAREMGCPEETVHTRLRRGLEALRRRLGRRQVSCVMLSTLLTQHAMETEPAGLADAIKSICIGEKAASLQALKTSEEVISNMFYAQVKVYVAAFAAILVLVFAITNATRTAREAVPAAGAPVENNPPPESVPTAVPQRIAPTQPKLAAEPKPRAVSNRADNDSVSLALAWLAKAQEEDGHFDAKRHGGISGQDTAVTSLATLGWLSAGHSSKIGQFKESVRKAVVWLSQVSPPLDATQAALRTLALTEHYGMSREGGAAAQAALAHLLTRQDLEGSWTNPGESGFRSATFEPTTWALLALMSARVAGLKAGSSRDQALAFLDKKQADVLAVATEDEAAALASGLGMVRVFNSYAPDGEEVRRLAGVAATRLPVWPEGGLGEEVIGWHHGTLLTFQSGGAAWAAWNRALKETLVTHQEKSGNNAGSWDFRVTSDMPFRWGRIGSTSLACLCLEVYYRYLPVLNPQAHEVPKKAESSSNGKTLPGRKPETAQPAGLEF